MRKPRPRKTVRTVPVLNEEPFTTRLDILRVDESGEMLKLPFQVDGKRMLLVGVILNRLPDDSEPNSVLASLDNGTLWDDLKPPEGVVLDGAFIEPSEDYWFLAVRAVTGHAVVLLKTLWCVVPVTTEEGPNDATAVH